MTASRRRRRRTACTPRWVYVALRPPEGSALNGRVLRWPKFEGKKYGPWADVAHAEALTLTVESDPVARAAEVRAVPSMFGALARLPAYGTVYVHA